ncbi:nicotinamidase-like [Styela clava]
MCGNWLTRAFTSLGFQGWPTRMFSHSNGNATKKTALIVVDVQNDFISGSLALCNCPSKHKGEEVVPKINELVELPFWDLVVYSKDWHPPNHISFVSNTHLFHPHMDNKCDLTNPCVFDHVIYDVDSTVVEQDLWPVHCLQNSEGAEFHKDLKIVEGGVVVHKGLNPNIDSYSAFFDNGRRSETILQSVLRDNRISTVYVCGLATDVCVNFTTFDAHSLGFETYIIEDCCRGVHEENIEKTFKDMKEAGIKVVTSEDVPKNKETQS